MPLLELALIVVGAMLALALEDWQEERERVERARELLTLVSAEMQSNLQRLEQRVTYHRDMRQPILDSAAMMRNEAVFSLPDGWQGSKPIVLTKTAFELAASSNALVMLPPATALQLAEVYDEVALTEVRRNNTALVTLQTDFSDGIRYLRLLVVAIDIEVTAAETLVPALGDAIDVLDAELEAL
ncbi:MAG: hypothetical protein AAF270_03005 [Pseudomonadota bacterium]